jgi:hypothetical protein
MARGFKREDLQSLVGGEECEGLEVIEDKITGKSRWSVNYRLVFKDTAEGKFYVASYSRGATESQDESPFEHDDNIIECDEVWPVEKVVTMYERTPSKESSR